MCLCWYQLLIQTWCQHLLSYFKGKRISVHMFSFLNKHISIPHVSAFRIETTSYLKTAKLVYQKVNGTLFFPVLYLSC